MALTVVVGRQGDKLIDMLESDSAAKFLPIKKY